jgi:hypothetical protein
VRVRLRTANMSLLFHKLSCTCKVLWKTFHPFRWAAINPTFYRVHHVVFSHFSKILARNFYLPNAHFVHYFNTCTLLLELLREVCLKRLFNLYFQLFFGSMLLNLRQLLFLLSLLLLNLHLNNFFQRFKRIVKFLKLLEEEHAVFGAKIIRYSVLNLRNERVFVVLILWL